MIEAKDIAVSFSQGFFRKPFFALNGFNIQVNKGDIFGLLGPNGAGKSTAMYCLLGLIKPNKGSVRIFDAPPVPGSALFEKVAYLPEEAHYHLYLTVEEAINYYASLYRSDIPKQKVDSLLERMGLTEFKKLTLEKCSKGMKQKVGIAACMLNDPDVIFMDEPTRGLDPIIVKEVRDILLELNARGTTIVINSHLLSEVELICNRVGIMNRGKIIRQDELKNLITSDLETYSIRVEAKDALPDFVKVLQQTDRDVRGLVGKDRLHEFFRYVREKGITIFECSLKRLTLEEAVVDLLKKENQDA